MTRWRRPADLGALLSAASSILYPILIVSSIHLLGPYPTVILACALLLLGLVRPSRLLPVDLLWLPLVVIAVIAAVGLFAPELGVRLYPVAMSTAFLWAFAHSLWRPPSMIERFARLMEPDLDARGVCYTRTVTKVWIGFFAINGAIALWTALAGSWLQWTLYNGALSYALAGLLMAGEYLVRQRVRRHGRASR
jgi:uncharacterized membrane protein